MKKIIVLLMLLSSFVLAKESQYLGTFTINNYPLKGCEIVKIGSLYSLGTVGIREQSQETKKGFLNDTSDIDSRSSMENKAIKNGFNAILGYRYYVSGAFDT